MVDRITVRKSLRSVWRNKKSYFSGIFVLAVGLSMFIGMLSGYLLFMRSARLFHEETNFADVFASVISVPAESVGRLTRIEGVAAAQGALKHPINARLDGVDDIIGVLLVGVDIHNSAEINLISYTGEGLASGNDIWVSSAFYNARGLGVGDTIRLQINGRYEVFTIRGTVLSPEYIFPPSVSGSFADESLNTVGYVRTDVVETAARMPGVFNEISIVLEDFATFEDVEPALTDALERYGLISLIERERHGSYLSIIQQSTTLVVMATIFPIFLLSIAIGMLYVTLKRLISMERTEIGTLKAIGFSDRYIMNGYLLQGVLAAIISFVLAVVLAWVIGGSFYNLIVEFFDLEWLPFSLNMPAVVSGFFIALIVSLFGVIIGAKSSLKIKPAEAMREAPPSSGTKGSKFNGFFFKLLLDVGGKLAIRSMQRNRRRVVITVASIAAIFALMNTMFTSGQFISDMIDDMFLKIEISDGTIILNSSLPRDAIIKNIGQMQGVLEIETLLTMPLDFVKTGRTLAVRGVAHDAVLYNIFDNDGRQISTNGGGLILSRFFADELGVSVGQTVSVNHTSFRSAAEIEVTQIYESATGVGAYMELTELSMLFGREVIANSVLINTQDGFLQIIFDELFGADNISSLTDNERAHAYARINADLNNAIFNMINLVAVIICFAIVYNISSIALGEKQREYATLRILGFQAKAVREINTFEYVIMLIIGSILGIGLSLLFIPLMGSMFSFEQAIVSVKLTAMPSLQAFIGCAAAVAFSCVLIGMQIKKFNLVDVLKER